MFLKSSSGSIIFLLLKKEIQILNTYDNCKDVNDYFLNAQMHSERNSDLFMSPKFADTKT